MDKNLKNITKNTYKKQDNFNWLLAGIIDGDGHISLTGIFSICFHQKDIKAALLIKEMLGFGKLRPIKNKKAFKFTCGRQSESLDISQRIQHKLKHDNKILQYNTRLCDLPNFSRTNLSCFNLKNNAWFSGFFYSDGSFQIKIINRKNRKLPEIRLVIQISQKKETLLALCHRDFGGYKHYRSSNDSYYWSSISLSAAEGVVEYFDRFPPVGAKKYEYIIWRRVFVYLKTNKQRTLENVEWIKKQKISLSKLKLLPQVPRAFYKTYRQILSDKPSNGV